MYFEMPSKFEVKCMQCGDVLSINNEKFESKRDDNIYMGSVENEGFISCSCGNYVEIF